MPPDQTIQSLFTAAAQTAADQTHAAARRAARQAWAKQIVAALEAAQKEADAAWMQTVADQPEDMDDEEADQLPPPPEQARLDAIRVQIDAVLKHDRWPRKLYWSGV